MIHRNPTDQASARQVEGQERFEVDLPFDLTGAIVQPDICAACASGRSVQPALPRIGVRTFQFGIRVPRTSIVPFPLCLSCAVGYWLRLAWIPIIFYWFQVGTHLLGPGLISNSFLIDTMILMSLTSVFIWGPFARKLRQGNQAGKSVRLRIRFSHLDCTFRNRYFAQRFCDLNGIEAHFAKIEQEPLQLHLPHQPMTIEPAIAEPQSLPPIQPDFIETPFEPFEFFWTESSRRRDRSSFMLRIGLLIAYGGTMLSFFVLAPLARDIGMSSRLFLGTLFLVFLVLFLGSIGFILFYPSINARAAERERRKESSWRNIKAPPSSTE